MPRASEASSRVRPLASSMASWASAGVRSNRALTISWGALDSCSGSLMKITTEGHCLPSFQALDGTERTMMPRSARPDGRCTRMASTTEGLLLFCDSSACLTRWRNSWLSRAVPTCRLSLTSLMPSFSSSRCSARRFFCRTLPSWSRMMVPTANWSTAPA
ncbi:hypothetical protein D9M68_859150 [compost metagenome]